MNSSKKTLSQSIIATLSATKVSEKISLTFNCYEDWKEGKLDFSFEYTAPDRPGRPNIPELLLPKDMPRRRNAKAKAARIAMLHAIAHIEFNAIDLALDIVLRFGSKMPREFSDDWLNVANDEARHFVLLEKRLADFNSFYGALPAHDGLWQSAENTSHDLLARLAIVPLVLQARGLDVTPTLIAKFESANDYKSSEALKIIYEEEIDHVKAGYKWFNYICELKGLNPQTKYQELVKIYFAGSLKPPFNIEARKSAGLAEDFYMPMVHN